MSFMSLSFKKNIFKSLCIVCSLQVLFVLVSTFHAGTSLRCDAHPDWLLVIKKETITLIGSAGLADGSDLGGLFVGESPMSVSLDFSCCSQRSLCLLPGR